MAATPYSSYSKNPIKSRVELTEVENEFDQKDEWVFRGQHTLAFPATSLERHCKNLNLSGVQVSDLEIKLIRDFARSLRKKSLILKDLPAQGVGMLKQV